VIVSVRFGETASVVLPLAYGGAGVFVAWRRPANPIGWLLVLMGWGLTLGPLRVPASAERLLAGDLDPGVAVAAWGNSSGYSLAFAALVAITGLVPDGHLPVDRWRMATIATIVAATVSCVVICLNPVITPTPVGSPTAVVVGNPFALAPDAAFWSRVPDMNTLYPVLATIVGVAAAGLVMRSRRASPVARMQYRWFIAAIVLVLVCTSIWAIATSAFAADSVGPLFFLAILSMAAIPIAIGVAISGSVTGAAGRVVAGTASNAGVPRPSRRRIGRVRAVISSLMVGGARPGIVTAMVSTGEARSPTR
jgi:hypothetical protein